METPCHCVIAATDLRVFNSFSMVYSDTNKHNDAFISFNWVQKGTSYIQLIFSHFSGRFGKVHKCTDNKSRLRLAAKIISSRSAKERVSAPSLTFFSVQETVKVSRSELWNFSCLAGNGAEWDRSNEPAESPQHPSAVWCLRDQKSNSVGTGVVSITQVVTYIFF